MQDLSILIAEAQQAISDVSEVAALDRVRVHYLGKKGVITAQLKQLGSLPIEERKIAGQTINQAKQLVASALDERRHYLQLQALNVRLEKERIDVSLPGRGLPKGGLHPITRTIQRISMIFRQLGFEVAEGPEIEDDFHNFTALNIPEHHPARAMHDTFYFADSTLLRTHTSPVQVRDLRFIL